MNADALLREIEKFLSDTGMTPTAFGRDAMHDPGFVFGVREGRDIRLSTAERVRQEIMRYRRMGTFSDGASATVKTGRAHRQPPTAVA
jgi:predicted transcriptional regulator